MTYIAASGLAVEFAGQPIFENVTFTIAQGDRWGIVGRNGTGKTTLFRVLAGEYPATRGSVSRAQGLTISMLDQHRDFGGAASVWDAAAGPLAELFALEQSLAEQATRMGELGEHVTQEILDQYSHDLERFERAGGYGLGARVDAVLAGLGFDPVAARETPVAVLSGGERGRVALVRQLVAPADVFLLDEPTNHLDLDTTRWLEKWLREQQATLMVVSHDRAFLRAVADHVLHVEAGTMTPYDCAYDAFVHLRNERRAAQQKAFDKQKKALDAQYDYIARNIAGHNASNAKGRRRRLDRVERLAPPPGESTESIYLRLEPADRGGDQVLVAENVRLAQGERELVRGFSASVRRGDVVALVGSNGTGKSTLLKVLAGERHADGGEVRIPPSIALGYYRQDLSQVPQDETLYDAIANRRTLWGRGQVQSHLGRFGFSGDSVLRKAKSLSGGERARMGLALLELEQPNLVLIDEPTNHLDVETIEALEDGLSEYEGTLILVSHDRALLRALATRVWALVDGRIEDYPGTFEEWEQAVADRAKQGAAEARARAQKKAEASSGRKDVDERKAAQSAARSARRALEEAEAEVTRGEAEVAGLKRQLEDPALYAAADGAARAKELADRLRRAQGALDASIARWEAASAAAERAG